MNILNILFLIIIPLSVFSIYVKSRDGMWSYSYNGNIVAIAVISICVIIAIFRVTKGLSKENVENFKKKNKILFYVLYVISILNIFGGMGMTSFIEYERVIKYGNSGYGILIPILSYVFWNICKIQYVIQRQADNNTKHG